MAAGLASGNPPSQAGDVHGRTSRSVAVQRRFTHSGVCCGCSFDSAFENSWKTGRPIPMSGKFLFVDS